MKPSFPRNLPIFLISLFLLATSCKTMEVMTEVGATVGVASGTISESQAAAIKKSSKAVAKTFADITPKQEYYIGRSVGAVVLSRYPVYKNSAATAYVNRVGQTLARFSDMPETFNGYHFLILDSDEINAFAAPGGLIFITRGMLEVCRNETELAAVLAHEIGHVTKQHGLQAIRKGRIHAALTTIAVEGAKAFAGGPLAELTDAFGDSIQDISTTMMNNGYSRGFEREADASAVTILTRSGYNPTGLIRMLEEMEHHLTPGHHDFASTHPHPAKRIADVKKKIAARSPLVSHPVREERFARAMGR